MKKKYRIVKGGRLDNFIYCTKTICKMAAAVAVLPLWAIVLAGFGA